MNTTIINNRGTVTITQLLISFVVVLMVITSILIITGSFFSVPEYASDYNSTYYSSLQESNMETNGSNVRTLSNSVYSTSDKVLESNSSVGGTTPASEIDIKSFDALTSIKSSFVFVKSMNTDLNEKLKLPKFFGDGLLWIVIIIVVMAILAALRGINP